jgi:hypothetical protein
MTRALLLVLGALWLAGQIAVALVDCKEPPRGVSATGREHW